MGSWKSILLLVAAGYVGLVVLMYVAQRSLMYFPERARTLPAAAGLPEAQEVVLDTSDGERVIVWHVKPRAGRPLILYFHGNGGSLRLREPRFRLLIEDGTGLLALSYRGYGGSSGSPSEEGFMRDAAALYAYARAQHPQAHLVFWGESLGTGVAVALAAGNRADALVLEAPFTATVDIAAAIYPFVPVRLLMKDQFRSYTRIGMVKAPILVLHGALDRIVPIGYGERLFALAPEPKSFVRFPLGGHENLNAHGAVEAAKAFLAGHGIGEAAR